jgi:EmrB/QacA subfamily drug resistance transporter
MATVQQADPPKTFDPELRRLALVVIAGAIMTVLDTTIVNVAITPLSRSFHSPLPTIQWVLTGYTLALSMTIPLTAWAVERFGGKTMWIASLVIFIAGSVLCGAAWSVPALIAFRILQGVGGGMLLPVGQTMLARKAGPERMGRVMSVIAVPAMLAPVLGPVIGGLILDHLSWRWMFYVNVPICAVALVLAVRLLPADTERRPARIDTVGLLLLSPGLAAVVFGLSRAGQNNTALLAWVAAGVLAVAAFVVHALRKKDGPLLDLRAFRRRPFSAAVGTLFLYSGALFGLMVVLPVYYQVVRGSSPLEAGLMVAPLGVGAMLTMPISGRLTDKAQPRVLAVAGILVVAVSAIVFAQIGVGTSLVVLAAAAFIAGLGHGLLLPAAMGAAYQGMSKPEVPSATATSNVALRVGSSFGAAALAIVLQISIKSHISGASGSLADAARLRGAHDHSLLTQAFGQSFWWVVAIVAAALVPALLIPRRPVSAH